jgi:integrase
MKVFKDTYTKPRPDDAKVFSRKGKAFCRFTDRQGHTHEARLTKAGDRMLVSGAVWHIGFTDNLGISRKIEGFTDHEVTQDLAKKIEKLLNCQANHDPLPPDIRNWVERAPGRVRDALVGFSVLDGTRAAGSRPLTDLLTEFVAWLACKEGTARYVKETKAQLQRIFTSCGFKYFGDISAGKLVTWLKGLRDKPDGDGISFRRSNGYLMTAKLFCNWAVESSYATDSPLKHLDFLNNELDRRLTRRAATADELKRLLVATLKGPVKFGMSGAARALLYRFAVESGLRVNELRTLRISSLDFDNSTVTVETAYSKHRQKDSLPLRPDMVNELKVFVSGKPPTALVFKMPDKPAKMLRADLAATETKDAAGEVILKAIPYTDDSGLRFDFHAFRHTFITNVASKAPTSVAQALARHRSSAMTDRYTHIRLHDERAALEFLPDLRDAGTESQRAVLSATGTDGKLVEILPKSCFLGGINATTGDAGGMTNHTGDTENALSNTPDRIRTCDLRIRNPLLYPAELRAQFPKRP